MVREWTRWLALGGTGGTAESRVLDLVLDLPGRRGEPSRKLSRDVLAAMDSWPDLSGHPIELLRRIERLLKRINTEAVAWDTHLQIVTRALQSACPAMYKVYQDHCPEDALPESHDRREGLSAAISSAHQLAIGYMHHLDRNYRLPLKRYLDQRERILTHALRVLELTYLEQRLRALRYQKLPRTTWQDINRLFFSFYTSGDAETLLPGQNCLQVPVEPVISGSLLKSPLTTLQQVFVDIHLLGLMDINTLSSRHLATVDELLTGAAAKAEIRMDDQQDVAAGNLLVYYGQTCPAYYARKDDNVPAPPVPFPVGRAARRSHKGSADPARAGSGSAANESLTLAEPLTASLKIDISWLNTMLPTHYSELLSQLRDNMRRQSESPDMSNRENVDLAQLATVDTMCRHLSKRQRAEAREYIIGNKVLHLVNGYMPVFQLLSRQQQPAQETTAPETSGVELRDALAGRSNLVDWNSQSAEMGQWLVMDASPGGVHIKTQETPFTTRLYIGQILVFSYSPEGLQQPTLGFVTRLNRFIAGEIEVIIQVLTACPQTATVQSETLSEQAMALPGILLLDDAASTARPSGLILHQSHRLTPASRVRIEVDGQAQWYYLGDLVSTQREFIVYTLQRDKLDNARLLDDGR